MARFGCWMRCGYMRPVNGSGGQWAGWLAVALPPESRFSGGNSPIARGKSVIRFSKRTAFSVAALMFLAVGSGPVLAQQSHAPRYVGSQGCADCHQAEAEDWAGSDHALAWTPPDAAHVLGDFNDAEFTRAGVTTRFSHAGDEFFIETDGPTGVMTRYQVKGVGGIKPLQQYLLETEPGKLQAFDIAWDVAKKTWYHLYPDQALPFSDGLHWTGPYKNWNARCADCHATGFEKNYDPAAGSYHSTQAEIGVGCEACHGPAEGHLNWAANRDTYDTTLWPGTGPRGFSLSFSPENPQAEIQQCAGCHSRREAYLDGNPLPGTPYHDAYRLSTLRPGLYQPDGQVLDEDYVYGSFLQSKMYAKGVRCTDCHNPHSGRTKAEGNDVCKTCHTEAGNPRFPSLPLQAFDDPSHYFHAPGSPGAQCKNCHMPERVYMGIDARRDHSFRIPRPDLSVTTGVTNACNDCHKDKDAAWAAAVLEEKFPNSTHRGPNFATVFAAPEGQSARLEEIAQAGTLPGIVRASALDLLAPVSTPEIAARMAPLLQDPDPLVRAAAVAVQRGAEPMVRIQSLVMLLGDPVRAVRSATAREFLDAPPMRMPDNLDRDLKAAMAEWQDSLALKADFPETQMVLGGIGLTTRNIPAALAAFSEATRLDPQRLDAWEMQIRILDATGDRDGVIRTVAQALAVNPGDPGLLEYQSQLR